MASIQLIYCSRPFGYDELTLAAIFAAARRRNKLDGITGSLICRQDLFLQLLEGPQAAVEASFARIARDSRHIDVVRLWTGESSRPLFPDWDMRHDPARSWMWTPAQVAAGEIERAPADALIEVFRRVAAEPFEGHAATF